jgi:hypothetical protein
MEKKKELTWEDKSLIRTILDTVADAMEWDNDYNKYIDGGNIVLSLDKDEMKRLKSILKKL